MINLERFKQLQSSIDIINTSIEDWSNFDLPDDLLYACIEYVNIKNNLNVILKKYSIEKV